MCSAPAISHQSIHRTGHESGHSGMVQSSSQATPRAPSVAHSAFTQKWLQSIRPRLHQLITLLASHEVVQSISLAQIFTYLPVLMEGRQLLKAEPLCILGCPELEEFHHVCCQDGVPLTVLGPMSKVWQHGAVQIIQAANSLPADIHPLNRISPQKVASLVAEIVYLPVYDATMGENATQGVVAAIELMISPQNTDVMIVANVISTVSQIMEGLNLALNASSSKQTPQMNGFSTASRPIAPMMRTSSVRMLSDT